MAASRNEEQHPDSLAGERDVDFEAVEASARHDGTGSWSRRLLVPALLLGFGLLFSAFAWDRDFWAPEEDDFAAVTREMDSGSWLLPTLAGEPYFEKPPLLYWLGLAAGNGLGGLFGFPRELSWRLIAALFGALGLGVTYLAGARFYNRRIALAAVLIQGTTVLFLRASSWYLTDGLFATAIAFSIVSFASAILRPGSARRVSLAGFAGLALACLAKSPLLAICLVGGPLLVFLLLHRRRLLVFDLMRLSPLTGLALVSVVVLPWYVWGVVSYPGEFLREALFTQHVDRLFNASSHQRPFWYYATTLPVDFLPWSIFLPMALFFAHSHFRRTSTRLFACWLLVTVVGLSLVSSKQGKYLLPAWTPLSVLIAAGLLGERESIWETFLGRSLLVHVPHALRGVGVVIVAAGVLTLSGGLVWSLGLVGVDDERILGLAGDTGFRLRAGSGALALGVFSFLAGMRVRVLLRSIVPAPAARWPDRLSSEQSRRVSTSIAWCAGCVAIGFLALAVTYGDLNAIKSAKDFTGRVLRTGYRRPLAIYGRPRGALLYYLDRPVRVFPQFDPVNPDDSTHTELESYLREDGAQLLIIDRDFERLVGYHPIFRDRVEEVLSGMVGSRRRYRLLRGKQ